MSGEGHVAGKPSKNIIMAYAINTGSKRITAVRFFIEKSPFIGHGEDPSS
jgi:hypothetical protein